MINAASRHLFHFFISFSLPCLYCIRKEGGLGLQPADYGRTAVSTTLIHAVAKAITKADAPLSRTTSNSCTTPGCFRKKAEGNRCGRCRSAASCRRRQKSRAGTNRIRNRAIRNRTSSHGARAPSTVALKLPSKRKLPSSDRAIRWRREQRIPPHLRSNASCS